MAQKLFDQVPQTGQLKYISPRTENAYVQLLPSIARIPQKAISNFW